MRESDVQGELVVLGLGSNKPRLGTQGCSLLLAAAIEELRPLLPGIKVSPFYKTRPMHVADQPDFCNAAVSGYYKGSPQNLLRLIHSIEAKYGRDRSRERRWGERTLDIDILVFGERVIKAAAGGRGLEIPHPRLTQRAFALRPLLDLHPDLCEPATRKKYSAYLIQLS